MTCVWLAAATGYTHVRKSLVTAYLAKGWNSAGLAMLYESRELKLVGRIVLVSEFQPVVICSHIKVRRQMAGSYRLVERSIHSHLMGIVEDERVFVIRDFRMHVGP